MASCVWKPKAINTTTGQEVDSKLFNSLLNFSGDDRAFAKEYYGIGTNPEFLKEVSSMSEFDVDENGEITFESLRKITKIDLGTEKELRILNSNYSDNTTMEDAIIEIQTFNNSNPYRDKYLATFDTNFNTKIVPKTAASEKELTKKVKNLNLRHRLNYYLAKYRRAITDSSKAPILSISENINAEEWSDGLLHLYRDVTYNSDYTTESAKMVVELMRESPLMTRLLNLINEENAKYILGDDFVNAGNDYKEAAAAKLIEDNLNNNVDKNSKFKKILDRICNYIKEFIRGLKNIISPSDIKSAVLNADILAKEIIYNFVSVNNTDNFVDSEFNDLFNNESFKMQSFQKALKECRKFADMLEVIYPDEGRSMHTNLDYLTHRVEGDKTSISIGQDYEALAGLAELLNSFLVELEGTIHETIVDLNSMNPTALTENFVEVSKKIRYIQEFTRTGATIAEIVRKATTGESSIHALDKYGNTVTYNFKNLVDSMNDILNGSTGVNEALQNVESKFYIEFLKSIYGKDFVEISAKKVYNRKSKNNKLVAQEAQTISANKFFTDIIQNLDSDLKRFYQIASMTNNPDVVGQLLNKVIRWATENSDKNTFNTQAELLSIKNQFKKLGFDEGEYFCERDSEGKLTGNFISRYNWGEYEKDFEQFKKDLFEQFLAETPNLKQVSYTARKIAWREYSIPKIKEWRKGTNTKKGHAKWDADLNMYVPSDMYLNPEYDRKIAGKPIEEQYLKFLDIKKRLDKRLPTGSTSPYRMPQIEGRVFNRIQNNAKLDKPVRVSKMKIFKHKLQEMFAINAQDYDYGSDITCNDFQKDFFKNPDEAKSDRAKRIPLYYINKLKNPQEISTDIFGTMVAYSGMVYDNAALQEIVHSIEIGNNVLLDRTVEGIKERDRIGEPSKSYEKILDFTEKNLYNLNIKTKESKYDILIHKISNLSSRIAGIIFLGGNVHGGMVNLGTGLAEITKEGLAGQYFNTKDLRIANGIYFKNIIPEVINAVTSASTENDWLGLFIRHFDILGENNESVRLLREEQSAISRLFFESMYFPYSSGEHYMQTVPYLAMANNIKVYDNSGKEYKLLDIYKEVNLHDSNTSRNFSSKNMDYTKDAEEYSILKGILQTINNRPKEIKVVSKIDFTVEQVKYIKDNNLDTTTIDTLTDHVNYKLNLNQRFFINKEAITKYQRIEEILNTPSKYWTSEHKDFLASLGYDKMLESTIRGRLEEDKNNLLWTSQKEADFSLKAREVSNRLHGVYNNIDKTMFHRNLYGNMFLAMKGWALGYIERRFGSSKDSLALEGHSEGSFITLIKLLRDKDIENNILNTLAFLVFPFSSRTKNMMISAGYSESQAANVKRMSLDIVFSLLLSLLAALLYKLPTEDDPKDMETIDTIVGVSYYIISRVALEQTFFVKPSTFYSESLSLLDVLPVGASAIMTLLELAEHSAVVGVQELKEAVGLEGMDKSSDRYKKYYYKDGTPKLNKKVRKIIPYLKTVPVVEDPYKAFKNYEFGKKMN